MENKLRIIFMGTPAFGVPSLDALYKEGFDIAAVITAPDKPAGRGYKLHESEVKKYALAHDIPVLQPTNLKSPDFLEQLKKIAADLQVVVAFRMLPEVVWNMPPLGTINLHASLLPQYRGAAPINWAIINGEKETGVTTFKLQHAIDTGNILLQQKIKIENEDNAGAIHDKLMKAGAALILDTVNGLESGNLKEVQQGTLARDEELKHAPKIFNEDCEINWNNSTVDIYNLIRGLSPYPGAFFFLRDKRIKVLEADMEIADSDLLPGNYHTDRKTFLKFATSDGFIFIKKLKPEGKSAMDIKDFLRGRRDL